MAPMDSTQEVREEPGSIGVFAGHWNVKGLLLKKPRYLKLRNLILLAHWSLSFDMHLSHWSSLLAQMVKNLPAIQETQVWSLSWKILWRREWQHTSGFLPGEFHGQREEPGRLQSMGLQRVGHDWVTNTYFSAVWGRNPVFLIPSLFRVYHQGGCDRWLKAGTLFPPWIPSWLTTGTAAVSWLDHCSILSLLVWQAIIFQRDWQRDSVLIFSF